MLFDIVHSLDNDDGDDDDADEKNGLYIVNTSINQPEIPLNKRNVATINS